MRLPNELHAILLGFCSLWPICALANTEIVNFEAAYNAEVGLQQTAGWPVFNPTHPQALLRVLPAPLDSPITAVCEPAAATVGTCPHEVWLSLDLDEPPWLSYSKFTLRVSWPASHPAEFFLDIYSPEALAALLGRPQGAHSHHPAGAATTRRKYARIRLIHDGVFTPSPENRKRTIEPVPFMVIVEPLYLGILPASLVPTILFLLVLIPVTSFVVLSPISRYIFSVADQVRAEAVQDPERKKQ